MVICQWLPPWLRNTYPATALPRPNILAVPLTRVARISYPPAHRTRCRLVVGSSQTSVFRLPLDAQHLQPNYIHTITLQPPLLVFLQRTAIPESRLMKLLRKRRMMLGTCLEGYRLP